MMRSVFDLWFPKLCAGCDTVLLAQEKVLCLHCLEALNFIPFTTKNFPEMYHQFYGKLCVQYVAALFFYHKEGGVSKSIIQNLKYRQREDIGIFLAHMCWQRFRYHPVFKEADIIVAVPLHSRKQKQRGYNQLHLFCETLSRLSNIPFDKRLLIRKRYTPSQTRKSFFKRSDNTTPVFELRFSREREGNHFLLIDDVITTGSTIEQVGNVILTIPGSRLSVFSMAYTR